MGRGYSFATCLEGALKIKELAYMHSEGNFSDIFWFCLCLMYNENFLNPEFYLDVLSNFCQNLDFQVSWLVN